MRNNFWRRWYGGKTNLSSMVDKNDFYELFNQMLAEGMVHDVVVAPSVAEITV